MSENNNQQTHRRSVKEIYRTYPIMVNIILIVVASMIVVAGLLLFLNRWTLHGQEDIIPDIKGVTIDKAADILKANGMNLEITDSIFDTHMTPGTIVEQNPVATAKVKPGRTVYATIVAFSPKLVTVPDFNNVSMRQGVSMFEGLGLKNVQIRYVSSEYKDLVLGALFNGLSLRAGQKIPVTATVTLEVGSGIDETENFDDEF